MKTPSQTKKSFDAVKMMREIRDKIDGEIKAMTSAEVLIYYAKRRKKLEKQL